MLFPAGNSVGRTPLAMKTGALFCTLDVLRRIALKIMIERGKGKMIA